MRQLIVAGNWKMNGDKTSTKQLVENIVRGYGDISGVKCILFPPYVFIDQVEKMLQNTGVAWGGQNVCASEPGAYTGEISTNMLRDFGCDYVLVGHSERRTLYHEDNAIVAMKFAQAKRHHLTPILCVGETQLQRELGQTEQVVGEQLDAILSLDEGVDGFKHAIVAYEPVWAIGTGLTATPDQAQAVHHFIRERIAQHSAAIADELSILYGGSVKGSNARELFAKSDIDGGLIGGASLNADEFLEIMRCIS